MTRPTTRHDPADDPDDDTVVSGERNDVEVTITVEHTDDDGMLPPGTAAATDD